MMRGLLYIDGFLYVVTGIGALGPEKLAKYRPDSGVPVASYEINFFSRSSNGASLGPDGNIYVAGHNMGRVVAYSPANGTIQGSLYGFLSPKFVRWSPHSQVTYVADILPSVGIYVGSRCADWPSLLSNPAKDG